MPYMQPSPRGVGKHIENVEGRAIGVFGYLINIMLTPKGLYLSLYFREIILHSYLYLTAKLL